MGRIINLVVKQFLNGQDFQGYLEVEDDEEETIGFWRKRGAYGHLRNVIRYICWTLQRRDAFVRLCQHLQPDEPTFLPIAANFTRWNRPFAEHYIRNPLELFISRHQREGLSKDQLDPENWKE